MILEHLINEEIYSNLAMNISENSNLLNVEALPLFEDYQEEINKELVNDIGKFLWVNMTLRYYN